MSQVSDTEDRARPTSLNIANGIIGQSKDTVDGLFEDEVDGRPAMNKYAARKTFVYNLFDVALVIANVSQLKAVLDQGHEGFRYYLLQLICIAVSLILQIIFAGIMLWVWCIERRMELKCSRHNKGGAKSSNASKPGQNAGSNDSSPGQNGRSIASTPEDNGGCCGTNGRSKCCSSERANLLDEIGLVLVLLIIILNIVIAGFGITGDLPVRMSVKGQIEGNKTAFVRLLVD